MSGGTCSWLDMHQHCRPIGKAQSLVLTLCHCCQAQHLVSLLRLVPAGGYTSFPLAMQRRKCTMAGSTNNTTNQPTSTNSDAACHRGAEMQGAALCSAAVVLLVILGTAALLLQPQRHQRTEAQSGSMSTTKHTHAGNGRFASGLQPPYYSVIFTSQRLTGVDELGYATAAARMVELATQQPGFLGVESARGPDGLGITVSYWATTADIAAWRRQLEHEQARDAGRGLWYSHYELRVARVERAYAWDAADGHAPPVAAREAWLQQDTALSERKSIAEVAV